jgi:hypothetical protein
MNMAARFNNLIAGGVGSAGRHLGHPRRVAAISRDAFAQHAVVLESNT